MAITPGVLEQTRGKVRRTPLKSLKNEATAAGTASGTMNRQLTRAKLASNVSRSDNNTLAIGIAVAGRWNGTGYVGSKS
jgi:hypothetical protein